jgi:predicted dehydrogenase
MVRWGILGTASIAMRRLVPAIHGAYGCELAAIASRDAERARRAASDAVIPASYGSYQALLDDPAIDAVYIPLPNHLHVEWTIKALEAGKHVLCEKPIALSAVQARLVAEASARFPKLKVMEAFMYRMHPRWEAIRALVIEGGLGALGTIHTDFFYDNTNPGDIRNQAATGGGALLDIGCYAISVARWLFHREPELAQGTSRVDPRFGIDRLTSGVLDFGSGTATFSCATQLPWHQQVSITGSLGRIEVDRPFNPVRDHPTSFRLIRGEREEDEVVFPACDQYGIMVDRFTTAILEEGPVPTPIEDAIANMAVIDAVASGAASTRD